MRCLRTKRETREARQVARVGLGWRCYQSTKEKVRDWKKDRRYALRERLGKKCEICDTDQRLCWDHDHKTGEYRGTLCNNCNSGIGLFKDDPQRLRNAALYCARGTK